MTLKWISIFRAVPALSFNILIMRCLRKQTAKFTAGAFDTEKFPGFLIAERQTSIYYRSKPNNLQTLRLRASCNVSLAGQCFGLVLEKYVEKTVTLTYLEPGEKRTKIDKDGIRCLICMAAKIFLFFTGKQ